MPKALTPEEVAARAMARRARQAKGDTRQAKGDQPQPKKPARARLYTIRYGVLTPDAFSDWAIVWKHPGYSRPPAPTPNEEHGAKLVRTPYHLYQKQKAFYDGLEESVLREGVRNPIFAMAYKDGLFVRYGVSRLWMAKKHGIKVPVVVADYANHLPELEELTTEADIRAKYIDQPALIELHDEWMRIDGCGKAPGSVS